MNDPSRLPTAIIYIHVARYPSKLASRAVTMQRQAYQRCADELGLTVTGEYLDHGLYPDSQQRPGMNQLLTDLKEQDVSYVITYDHARVADSMTQYASIARAIVKAGAQLEIASLPRAAPSADGPLIGHIGSIQLVFRDSAVVTWHCCRRAS